MKSTRTHQIHWFIEELSVLQSSGLEREMDQSSYQMTEVA